MMMNKRLMDTVDCSKKYIGKTVALQWCSLVSNIIVMVVFAGILGRLAQPTAEPGQLAVDMLIVVTALIVKFSCTIMASRMSHLSSKEVKKVLREMIYRKLLRLGSNYRESIQT